MSEWTHIIGTVYYHSSGKQADELFRSANPWTLINKVQRGEITEQQYKETMRAVNVPIGSEGPLSVFESKEYLDPDNISTRDYRCVTFYGDLRDVGVCSKPNREDIIKWWKDIHRGLFVRQSTLQIFDEWTDDIILINCWGKYVDGYDWQSDKHEYQFSEVSIPRVGRRKNPRTYTGENK